MKKFMSAAVCAAVFCLSLTGCGQETGKEYSENIDYAVNETVNAGNDAATVEKFESDGEPESPDGDVEASDLKEPELLWCQLYNPNGFNTVTGLIYNPNSVDIDISYDLVFFKDGKEVRREEAYSSNNIGAGSTDVLWANWELPNPEDVDDIKMENVYVGKAYTPNINGSYVLDHEDDDEVYYKFSFDSRPMLTDIWFVFYNDDNKNGQPDNGEIVVTEYHGLIGDEDTVSYTKGIYNYSDVSMYFRAY